MPSLGQERLDLGTEPGTDGLFVDVGEQPVGGIEPHRGPRPETRDERGVTYCERAQFPLGQPGAGEERLDLLSNEIAELRHGNTLRLEVSRPRGRPPRS